MGGMKLGLVALAALVLPGTLNALCLTGEALEKMHDEVFSGRELLPLELASHPLQGSTDFGYSYARRGDVALVHHFRPNYRFDYIVTLLDEDALIEARYRAEAQSSADEVEGSFVIVLHDDNPDDYAVICGAEDVGPLTIGPISEVLQVLKAQTD